MNYKLITKKIKELLLQYQSISLDEMQNAALMDRVDTKFVASVDLVPELLSDLCRHYRILEIDGERDFLYKTDYYDTKTYDMYEAHQNGKLNRYKVRKREYVSSGLHFLEVKFKNNKRRTIKKRIERKEGCQLSNPELAFLNENIPYKTEELELKLSNAFRRITLAGFQERVTIDFGLSYTNNKGFDEKFYQIAIVELKQMKYSSTTYAMNVLRKYRIKRQSFSKYCLGASTFNSHIKSNRMKSKFELIKKIELIMSELD